MKIFSSATKIFFAAAIFGAECKSQNSISNSNLKRDNIEDSKNDTAVQNGRDQYCEVKNQISKEDFETVPKGLPFYIKDKSIYEKIDKLSGKVPDFPPQTGICVKLWTVCEFASDSDLSKWWIVHVYQGSDLVIILRATWIDDDHTSYCVKQLGWYRSHELWMDIKNAVLKKHRLADKSRN